MRKVEIELMTVTPLFLGGSDPRGQPPELRPPSFRGAMRYWYRAALGGVVGDDWKKVRQLEGKVFGITSDKQENEGQGSAVNVRISQLKLPIPRDYIKERRQPP
jgi:CRISPR-associated protein Cmr1